jgi:hypothetical protein
MRDQLAALNAAESLASLDLQAPWDRRDDAGSPVRMRELEQSLAAALARTGAAERELESARRRIAELTRADQPAPDADRDALVAELAEGIRAAATAGDKWSPDYEDLMRRTGRQRRWCEYLVRDARSAVFGADTEPAPGSAAQSARGPAQAGAGAEGHARQPASVNGHHAPAEN